MKLYKRICKKCGRIYTFKDKPKTIEFVCDDCIIKEILEEFEERRKNETCRYDG